MIRIIKNLKAEVVEIRDLEKIEENPNKNHKKAKHWLLFEEENII